MKKHPLDTLPGIEILLNQQPLPESALTVLAKIEVRQALSLPAMCQIELNDPEDTLAREADFEPGTMLEISIEGFDMPLFSGQLTVLEDHYEVDGMHRVVLRGYDLLNRLRKKQHVRSFEEVSTGELIREAAAGIGLRLEAHDTGPSWKHLVQFWETDLEFLTKVADDSGLFFSLRKDTLHLFTLEGVGLPLTLEYGHSLFSGHFDLNAERSCRTVRTRGWALDTVEPEEAMATQARSGLRVEAQLMPEQVGGEGERYLADEAQPAELLTTMVQGDLDRHAAGEVTFQGVSDGNPALMPGARVEICGVSQKFAGQYVLTRVRHRITPEEGFVSEVDTLPPPPRRHPWGTICTVGKVAGVDDPQALGRIQVQLPGYEDLTSGWLQVTMPAAGKDKGLTMLPAIGDWVLVIHPRENLNQGVVVGGLYGSTPPPDSGVEDNRVRRYTFRTPEGQVIQLDDDRQAIILRNSDGSHIEMTGEHLRIHASQRLELEAPGKPVVIRGQTIDFEEA